jgi:opacity protein-like surface antigen
MKSRYLVFALLFVAVLSVSASSASAVKGRFGLHVIRLEPEGDDAERFSDESWGGNIEFVVVPPGVGDFFALNLGFEAVVMDAHTIVFRNRVTGLRTEQQTNQNYMRLFAGGRVGHQGHGFLRPYAGLNLALNIFTLDTDVVIPDDTDPENEIRQELESETELAAGFDVALGLELNFSNKWYLDLGAKYIKAFNVPQQLGDDAETIYPQYFEFYAGAGLTFGFLKEHSD